MLHFKTLWRVEAGKPWLIYVECTPDSDPWPLSKSPRILCVKFKVEYRAWLYNLITRFVYRGNVNITSLRQVWTCGFKPLMNRSESICDYIIFLNYDRQAYNKVKIKNSSPKSPSKAGFLLIICFPHFLQQTQCLIMSYQAWGTFHTNRLVAKETPLPPCTSSCFPPILLKGEELMAQGQDIREIEAIDPA